MVGYVSIEARNLTYSTLENYKNGTNGFLWAITFLKTEWPFCIRSCFRSVLENSAARGNVCCHNSLKDAAQN
ncbi:hypothetical protein ACF0H5_016729 [Mactra antiquata]